MTGAEVPAAAILGLAKKAVDDRSDREALKALAANSPAMQAASETYARRVAVKQQMLLKAYQPLRRFFGISREYFEDQFAQDMAAKLADVPDEHLASPPASVAVPAMEGLGYSIEDEVLREMYLSLLATATDGRIASQAHPSFAEIIKQLSPDEAEFLLVVLGHPAFAIVQVKVVAKRRQPPVERIRVHHVMDVKSKEDGLTKEEPLLAVWVDNWIRLGLVNVDYRRQMALDGCYEFVASTPEYLRIQETETDDEWAIATNDGMLTPSAFGQRFRAAVSYDGVPIPGGPSMPLTPEQS